MASHGVPYARQFAPVNPADDLEMHLALLDTAGYTLVPNAIPPQTLAQVQAMFDRVVGTAHSHSHSHSHSKLISTLYRRAPRALPVCES
jgi:hypothetical protein